MGRWLFWSFVAAWLFYVANVFAPPPRSVKALAIGALANLSAYFVGGGLIGTEKSNSCIGARALAAPMGYDPCRALSNDLSSFKTRLESSSFCFWMIGFKLVARAITPPPSTIRSIFSRLISSPPLSQ